LQLRIHAGETFSCPDRVSPGSRRETRAETGKRGATRKPKTEAEGLAVMELRGTMDSTAAERMKERVRKALADFGARQDRRPFGNRWPARRSRPAGRPAGTPGALGKARDRI